MSNQEVLAVVAGVEIKESDLQAFLENVPQDQRRFAKNPQFREHYLEQLIGIHLFAKMGEDMKLEETEEFKKIIANAKKDILAQMAMAETMKGVEVSDEEAEVFYNEHSDEFAEPETVSAKHILVEDEDKCKEILAAIENGETTFEEAAKAHSTCPSGAQGGDLGVFGKGQMVPEFEVAAFDAEVDAVVGPVKTQFGYHLIKVEEKNEASTIPFADVKKSIKGNLVQKKQQDAYLAKVAELKDIYMEK